jgi:hypothetical protein
MLKKIANWISGGAGGPIAEHGKLRRGGADVEGVIHASDLLVSPIDGQECVCFYYWAKFASSRAIRFSQSSLRPLRHATVYADEMFLDLDGGRVLLDPRDREDFTAEDHAVLVKAGIQGFRAKEQLVKDGARVRAHGKLRQTGDQWRLKLDYLAICGGDQPRDDDEPEEHEPPTEDF